MKNWISSTLALACVLAAGPSHAQKLPLHVAAQALWAVAELQPRLPLDPVAEPPIVTALRDASAHLNDERADGAPGAKATKASCKACAGEAGNPIAAKPAAAGADGAARRAP